MKSVLPFAVGALAWAAACASPNFDEPDPLPLTDEPTRARKDAAPLPTGSGSAPAPSTSPPPPVDAGPQAKRWKGTLAATAPVEFGGGQYCKYRITLKQLTVEINASRNGDIVAASVTADASEQALGTSCGAPIPAHTHTYTLVKTTVLPSGASRVELAGAATNNPPASLILEGDFRTAFPAVSLQWHRTNVGPPLDWRVNAEITTTAQ